MESLGRPQDLAGPRGTGNPIVRSHPPLPGGPSTTAEKPPARNGDGGCVHPPAQSCQVTYSLGEERPHGRDTHQPAAHDVEVVTGEECARVG